MPVIYEETEENLPHENFWVTPLTGKYRTPAVAVIGLGVGKLACFVPDWEVLASCNACQP
jgi:hypothetical protein